MGKYRYQPTGPKTRPAHPQPRWSEAGLPDIYREGIRRAENRDWESAAAAFRETAALCPASPLPLNRLGGCLLELNRLPEALEVFNRAVEADRQYYPAYNNQAAVWEKVDNLVEAAACLQRALDVNPDYKTARENLDELKKKQARPVTLDVDKLFLPPPGARPSLSLCLIAKDEAENLPRLFESAEGVVDEIVVADTGSVDATLEICQKWGVRVVNFPWRDDFSAAKNAALAAASGDWILHLDADMAIPDGMGVRLLKAAASGRCQAYGIAIRSGHAGGNAETVIHPWLFANLPGIRFSGRVHETLWPQMKSLGIQPQRVEITIDHFGYEDPAGLKSRFERDVRILEASLADGEKTTLTHYYLGRAYRGLEQPEKALDYLTQAIDSGELGPQILANAYADMVRALLDAGKKQEALEMARRTVRLFPNDPALASLTGQVHQAAGLFTEAIPYFQRALTLEPAQAREGLALFIQAPYVWKSLGMCFQELGRWSEASQAYQQATAGGLQGPEVELPAGVACWRSGDLQGALERLIPFVQRFPDLGAGRQKLGQVFLSAHRFQEAVDELEQASRLGFDDEETLGALEAACIETGQGARLQSLVQERASSGNLSEAVRARLGQPPANSRRRAQDLSARARRLLAERRHAEAAEVYEQAIALAPDLPELHNDLAVCLAQQGKVKAALLAFADELEINPRSDQVFNNLGALQARLGNRKEAAACFGQALHLNPHNDAARRNLEALQVA